MQQDKRDIVLIRQESLKRLVGNADFKTFMHILHEDSCRALLDYDSCDPVKEPLKFYQIKAQRWFVEVNIPGVFNDYLNFENKKKKFSFWDWFKKTIRP